MDLEAYLANADKILANFESAVGWKSPAEKQSSLVSCPYQDGHRMPVESLDRHIKSCKWRRLGYTKEEIVDIHEQEERTKLEKNCTVIDSDNIISRITPGIIPIRSDEHYKSLLNCDQRQAIYDATVVECYSSDKPIPDKALYADLEAKAAEKLYQKENPDNLSETELLQKMRDMKRRRQSYRAKNVHITKRSQTEIIRGVLAVHMEELTKLWNPEVDQRGETSRTGEDRDDGLPQSSRPSERQHAQTYVERYPIEHHTQHSHVNEMEQASRPNRTKLNKHKDYKRREKSRYDDSYDDRHYKRKRKCERSSDRTSRRSRRSKSRE